MKVVLKIAMQPVLLAEKRLRRVVLFFVFPKICEIISHVPRPVEGMGMLSVEFFENMTEN